MHKNFLSFEQYTFEKHLRKVENRERDKSARYPKFKSVLGVFFLCIFFCFLFFAKHHFKRLDFFMFLRVSGRKFKGVFAAAVSQRSRAKCPQHQLSPR